MKTAFVSVVCDFKRMFQKFGMGNGESGIGNRESGEENRESGIGNRESGIGNRERRIGNGKNENGKLKMGGEYKKIVSSVHVAIIEKTVFVKTEG